ncbi:MAG: efflux RND transporter permease subunit [Roseibacillus sp.]|nr:efflux RND transporter permease subunit [Roseibacillus sp.]
MKNVIRWFSRNHVAANFLMLAVLLAGFYTWFQLKKEIFPEISVDAVSVGIAYPNASPEDVEEGVVLPVEEAIADLDGIREINSVAAENMGMVTVKIENGYEVRDVMDDIKAMVDASDNLAQEAERPVLEELRITSQVVSIAVSGEVDEYSLRRVAEDVRDGLLDFKPSKPKFDIRNPVPFFLSAIRKETEITKVELAAVRPYEISIEVSESGLRQFDLTMEQVANAVRQTSLDLPGGSVQTSAGEVVIRALGKPDDSRQFEEVVVVSRPDGSTVKLGEIARVVDGFEEIDLSNSFDGRKAILINVFRTGEQDTLRIRKAISEYLQQARTEIPEGIRLEVWNDTSIYLQGRVDLLKRNGTWGLILVFLVLALFLRPSLAFLVALGIPVSFAGGIWLMPQMGISINMISLFGFILVLGIVVDDAIIVGENVYRRMRSGEDPRTASWRGTHEVGVVVIFGVLTTMVAFTPMLGLSGVSGKIWPNIPLIVIPTLMFSLVQSKLVLPAHLALLRPSDPARKSWIPGRLQRKVSLGLERFVIQCYSPFLKFCLRHRYIVLAIFLAALSVTVGLVKGKWIKSMFFPQVEADLVIARYELPRGGSFQAALDATRKIEKEALELAKAPEMRTRDGKPVIRHMLASAGVQPFITNFSADGVPSRANIGEVTMELAPSADREITSDEIVRRWREQVKSIPGAVELTFIAQAAGGGNAIDLLLTGNDQKELRDATDFLRENLEGYIGVIDIADSDRPGKRELICEGLTDEGRAAGLRLGDVAAQVRRAFYGEEVQRLQRGHEEVKVMVRYPEGERQSVENFEQMKLRTPQGSIPLMQAVTVRERRGPDTIRRSQRKRAIRITADVDRSMANSNDVVKRFKSEVLTQISSRFPGVEYVFEGEQSDQAESVREIGIGFLFALIAMYVIMAIPLRSYLQPLIIMSVIPFGIVGAVFGHIVMGTELSIMSMCGFVALAGVVVNDSLLMVDYVNRHRQESTSVVEAAIKAGGVRFRAILLTSLTTFAGLMPMLLETDIQARFLVPMAISLGFGILFATTITLVLVPSVYVMLEDFRRGSRWLLGKRDAGTGTDLDAVEMPGGE